MPAADAGRVCGSGVIISHRHRPHVPCAAAMRATRSGLQRCCHWRPKHRYDRKSASAGVDVAITRTFFATTLILTTLSGHPEVMVPCLCASLVSLFVTLDFPFIGPQRSRRRASSLLSIAKIRCYPTNPALLARKIILDSLVHLVPAESSSAVRQHESSHRMHRVPSDGLRAWQQGRCAKA